MITILHDNKIIIAIYEEHHYCSKTNFANESVAFISRLEYEH